MESLSISTSDLHHHVVSFGIDVYPVIEIRNERTRLNMFFEAARDRWNDLFDRVVSSDVEFKVSKRFGKDGELEGQRIPCDTFVLTGRGPVFTFPLLLPEPVGETNLEGEYVERFNEVRGLFFSHIPERKVLRVGMVRELVFGTGKRSCVDLLAAHADFAGAELVGGYRLLQYRDARCNVRLQLTPVAVLKRTQLPVGHEVAERDSFGLQVRLDVNNQEIKPLNDADIHSVVDRATSLWPDVLLRYLNEGNGSS